MINPICAIDWCDRPVGDGYVCQHCADRLSRALGDVPGLWEELDTVLTKQARYAAAEFRRGEQALPFNPAASELGTSLRGILNTWCRLIAEERGKELPDDTAEAVSRWLLNHVTWLRHHQAGAEAVEEMTNAVSQVRRAVDRPAERIYAGPCADCHGDMYGKPGATSVECRPCGLEYPVEDMQAWMRSKVNGRLVSAREGVTLLSRFGLPVQQKTIDKWVQRNRLTPYCLDRQDRRIFLFGELIPLASASQPTLVQQEAS